MFNRLKSAVSGAVEGLDGQRPIKLSNTPLQPKHKYNRPTFLNLTEDTVTISRDKRVRPILTVCTSTPLPYNIGYAECVNAGKSTYNEDMSQVHQGNLKYEHNGDEDSIPYMYFGIFDGHAGYGAAIDCSKQLHHIIHQKLVDCIDAIVSLWKNPQPDMTITKRDLITGCLESSFCEMDEVINESRMNYFNPGGCAAIVALIIMGEIYIANAGDCRAVICDDNVLTPLSNDFSPYNDKLRIYTKASEHPELLGGKYTAREFLENPSREDLGKPVLYKDPHMTGWAFKTLVAEDLKLPLVYGIGRRSRIMGTIGVARGFGDFDLIANHHKTPIKPFLSCVPEVQTFTMSESMGKTAVLVMASDGLWDAVDAQDIVNVCIDLNIQNIKDRNKLPTIAMNLVALARGRKDYDSGLWVMRSSNVQASLDDVSVFVIPLGLIYTASIESDSEDGSDGSSSPMEVAPGQHNSRIVLRHGNYTLQIRW